MIIKVKNYQLKIKLAENEKIWDVNGSSHTSIMEENWEVIMPVAGRYLKVEVLNIDSYISNIVYLHKDGTVIVETKDSPEEKLENEKRYKRSLIPPSMWDKMSESPTYL